MDLVATNLARCYAMGMTTLKQILLQKCWQLIFDFFLKFGAAKSVS